MSYVDKFKPIHKRVLGYFGYTLLEAQSLPEDEKQELLDRMGDALIGDDYAPEPAELFNERGLIDSEEWEALDDLCDMVCWTPYRTVQTDDGSDCALKLLEEAKGMGLDIDVEDLLASPATRPRCTCEPMPVCNMSKLLDMKNIGYAQGVMEDGMPFVAELYFEDSGSLAMSIVLPEMPQYISDKSFFDPASSPDFILEGQDNGVLVIGMTYSEREDSFEELMYYTHYLEDMGVVKFATRVMEGSLEALMDLQGNHVVRDRITLVEDGAILAKTNLRFMPFPDGPNRFFEKEWTQSIFDDFQMDEMLESLEPEIPGSDIPPNCVFEDGEWRPCPYDIDEVDSSWGPGKGGNDEE